MLSQFIRAARPAVSGTVSTTFAGTVGSSTDLSNYTFTNVNIGSAASNRIVYVAVSATGNTGNSVTAVSVAGISATLVNTANSSFGTIGAAYVNIASGTTATIVVALSGVQNRCSVDVYAVYGSTSAPFDTALTVQPSTVTSVSNNVDIPTGAVAIYNFTAPGGTVTSTYSSAVEDYDGIVGGEGTSRSGARKQGTAINHTETLTFSASKSNALFAAVVWSPA